MAYQDIPRFKAISPVPNAATLNQIRDNLLETMPEKIGGLGDWSLFRATGANAIESFHAPQHIGLDYILKAGGSFVLGLAYGDVALGEFPLEAIEGLTEGDILYAVAAHDMDRIPLGDEDLVLQVRNGSITWDYFPATYENLTHVPIYIVDKTTLKFYSYDIAGWDSGTALPSALTDPSGMAVNPDGDILVLDKASKKYYTYDVSAGTWDTGVAIPLSANALNGIGVNPNGDIVVIDTTLGMFYTYDGSSWSSGNALPSQATGARGIAFSVNGIIRIIDSTADKFYTFTGAWDAGIALPTGVDTPTGIAVKPDRKVVIVDTTTDKFYSYDGVSWDTGISLPAAATEVTGIGINVLGGYVGKRAGQVAEGDHVHYTRTTDNLFTTQADVLSTPIAYIVGMSDKGFTIAWSSVDNATTYEWEWRKDTGSWTTGSSTGLSQAITTTLTTDDVITARVKATAAGYRDSDYGVATARYGLQAPVPTITSISATGFTASWDPVLNATNYLYRYKKNNGEYVNATTTGTSVTINTSISNNTTITFELRATATGFTDSAYGVTTRRYTVPTLSTPSVSISSLSESGYYASWGSVSNATNYNYRYRKNSGSWSYGSTSGTSRSVSVSLSDGDSVTFQVQATASGYTNSGYGSAYSTYSAPTPVPVPTLSTPSPSITALSATGYTASWGSISNATGYSYRYKKNNGSYSSGTTTSNTVNISETLVNDDSVTFEVKATASGYNDSAYGTATDTYSFTPTPTLSTPSPAISSLTATGYTASWSAISNATGYSYRYKKNNGSYSSGTTTSNSVNISESLVNNDSVTFEVKATAPGYNDSGYGTATDTYTVVLTRLSTPSPSVSVNSSGATATWSAVSNATSYSYRYRIYTGSWSSYTSGTTTSTSLSITQSLSVFNRVQVRVKATASGYLDSYEGSRTGTYKAARPARPTGLSLSLSAGTNQSTASWTAVSDPGITGYRAWIRVNSGSTIYFNDYSTNTTRTLFATLQSGDSVTFTVRATGSGTYYDSSYGSTASITGTV